MAENIQQGSSQPVFCELMQRELGIDSATSVRILQFFNDCGLVLMPVEPNDQLLHASKELVKIGDSYKAFEAGRCDSFLFHYRSMVEYQRYLYGLDGAFTRWLQNAPG